MALTISIAERGPEAAQSDRKRREGPWRPARRFWGYNVPAQASKPPPGEPSARHWRLWRVARPGNCVILGRWGPEAAIGGGGFGGPPYNPLFAFRISILFSVSDSGSDSDSDCGTSTPSLPMHVTHHVTWAVTWPLAVRKRAQAGWVSILAPAASLAAVTMADIPARPRSCER